MRLFLRVATTALVPMLLTGCMVRPVSGPLEAAQSTLNQAAEAYVRAVLALGEHDTAYVDAYYGPAAWRAAVKAHTPSLPAIEQGARARIAELQRIDLLDAPEMLQLRRTYLMRQLQALVVHAQRLQGQALRFEDEARQLYDVTVSPIDETALQAQLAPLAALLPGAGDLADRYNAYQARFTVAPDQLEAVMRAAIEEARRRTRARLSLPPEERFELTLVRNQPWSAYNWYQGGYRSRIEINTDLPVSISRVIELAVHEGYPGHHVYNALLEQRLVRERGWVEFSVYPLYSPQSLIAEGTADYAIALAFPPAERLTFVREVLFPLAGLDPAEAERYLHVTEAARVIGAATIEAARRYRNGLATSEDTVVLLQRYALASEARAHQRVKFFDAYGAYIVNYSMGEARVRDYVERIAMADPAQRWPVFGALLASPRLPSGLQP